MTRLLVLPGLLFLVVLAGPGCADPGGPSEGGSVRINEIVEGTLRSSGSAVYDFRAEVGMDFSVLLQVVSGSLTLDLLSYPGEHRLATLDRAVAGEPLGRHATPPIEALAGDQFRIKVSGQGVYRFQVYRATSLPERAPRTIVIGDTIATEDIHAPTDVDEFLFQGAAGDELIAYLQGSDLSNGTLTLTITAPAANAQPVAEVISFPVVREFELEATPRFTLALAGEYRVRVSTSVAFPSYVGAYRFQVRRIGRAPEVLEQTVLVGSSTIGEGLQYVGDIDEFSLVGTPGEEYNILFQAVHDDETAMLLEVPDITIMDPSGNYWPPRVTSSGTDSLLTERGTGRFALPQSGRVMIRVDAEAPGGPEPKPGLARGPYLMYVHRVNRSPESVAGSVSIGDSVTTERIDAPGDIDEFTLAVAVEDTVNIVLAIDSSSYWGWEGVVSVLGAGLYDSGTGQPVGGATVLPPPWAAASSPLVIPAGLYVLRVMDWNDRVKSYHGSYRLALYRIRSQPEISPGTVAIGDTVTESLHPQGDVDIFNFSGNKGDHIDLLFQGLGTPSEAGFRFSIRLARNLREIAWGSSPRWSPTLGDARTGRLTLPETGSYQIVVAAGHGGDNAAERGPYRFTLARLGADPEVHAATVALGEIVFDERLDTPDDVDEFTLRAAPGTELALFITRAVGATEGVLVEALHPETKDTIRTTPSYASTESTGRVQVPSSGELLVRVSHAGRLVGPYLLEVYPIHRAPERVSAAHTVGDTVTGEAVDRSGDIDEFRFQGSVGDRVVAYFETPNGVGNPGLVLELVAPGPGAVVASTVSVNPTVRLEDNAAGPVTLPVSGEYLIRVRGVDDRDGSGAYRFATARLP